MKPMMTLVAMCALVAGCATAMPQSKPTELLPQETTVDAIAVTRQAPETRSVYFEQQYREGKFEDPYWPLEGQYDGFGQLVMPASVRSEAAWAYISLGEDYLEMKDWGGAARAYWAALELVSRTVASRPDRERIIRSAFEGLEKVAEARGQHKWAKLMKFSARLADTYLISPQATKENAEFYKQMQTIQEAQKGLEQARQNADAQLWAGLYSVVQSGFEAANAARSGDSQGSMEFAAQGVTQIVDTGMKYNQAVEAITEINKKFGARYVHLRAAVADDVEAIEAGNSFIANGALFYLENAADPKPYMQLLKAFAKNKPQLRTLLAPYEDLRELELRKAFKEELKGALVQVEKFVARYERRGLEAPLQIAETVWVTLGDRHAARAPFPAERE